MNVMANRPRRLESYVGGQWVAGAKDGVPLLDASTGAPVAFIDSTGIDFRAILAYGREKGGPALRRLSFHERAAMLKALGQALMERIAYADGQLVTGSFMDYGMPRATHLPFFDVVSHAVPTETNPLGAKGAGEAGTVGALPAVMNAVADALYRQGVSRIDMPATPGNVWSALQEAKRK